MRKQITLDCDHCGQSYQKDLSEYKRNQKIGRKSFCSLSCHRKANPIKPNNPYDISKHIRKRDEFTPFRYILKATKNLNRKKITNNLTLQDLKNVWDSQNGVCPYTKIKMKLPEHGGPKIPHTIAASLDRIDSSLPYVIGNVHFIVRAINYLKNNMTHDETVQFLSQIGGAEGNCNTP
jgi:hypothetical protein